MTVLGYGKGKSSLDYAPNVENEAKLKLLKTS